MASPVDRLLARPRFGTGLCLARMTFVIERLPHLPALRRTDPLRVTGTNGKGTTVMIAAAVLEALGLRTGCFVSPHISRFEERFQISGQPVGPAPLQAGVEWFESVEAAYLSRHADDSFGAFEAITAAALHIFGEAALDCLVLEAGIGGRYDATRPVPGRIVALSSVDLEHTALLGPTLEHILYDKADLVPADGSLIAGDLPNPLAEKLDAYAKLRGFGVSFLDSRAAIDDMRLALGASAVRLRLDALDLGMIETCLTGRVQIKNAVLALLLVKDWLARNRPAIAADVFVAAARRALAGISLPLRFERIAADLVLDCAHTPKAAEGLAQTLREVAPGRPVVLVLGLTEGKTAAGILDPLLPAATHLVATRALHRGEPPENVAAYASSRARGLDVTVMPALVDALASAREKAATSGALVVVTGSFFAAAEARALALGQAPAALRFL